MRTYERHRHWSAPRCSCHTTFLPCWHCCAAFVSTAVVSAIVVFFFFAFFCAFWLLFFVWFSEINMLLMFVSKYCNIMVGVYIFLKHKYDYILLHCYSSFMPSSSYYYLIFKRKNHTLGFGYGKSWSRKGYLALV